MANNLIQKCWDKALDAKGFSCIYSKRIESVSRLNLWSKVLGILIPVLIGALLTSYYNEKKITDLVIIIATPLSIIQLVLSVYLVLIKSDLKQTTYSNLAAEYSLLNSEFDNLANFPPQVQVEFKSRYDILLERERGIAKSSISIKDKELRMGMRYGLREYQRSCAGCNKRPTSMKATECDICGNF
jgi:mobilome CxxCx(11)CxxC protein